MTTGLNSSDIPTLAECRQQPDRDPGAINAHRNSMLAEGDGGPCLDCGYPVEVWFAPNAVWNRVVPERTGLVCLRCFAQRAKRMGLDPSWKLEPERPAAVPKNPPTLHPCYMLGRLSTEACGDHGILVHRVPAGEYTALCGKRPGRRSVGWSEPVAEPFPTWCRECPRCNRKSTERNQP